MTDENLRLAPYEAVLLAQKLLDSGRPFHAHEVLEAAWKAAPAPERGLWKGLAQLAVGLTHARRANAVGAVALLRRGADAVGESGALDAVGGGATGQVAAPVDGAALCAAARALADRIERDGLASIPPHEVTLPLVQVRGAEGAGGQALLAGLSRDGRG